MAEEKQKLEKAAQEAQRQEFLKEQQKAANSRLLSGKDEPEKNELSFMYAAPPGLKEKQEKEEEEKARRQQLDHIGLGDEREKFLQTIQVRAPSRHL
jgi:CBF1 interacting corepressor